MASFALAKSSTCGQIGAQKEIKKKKKEMCFYICGKRADAVLLFFFLPPQYSLDIVGLFQSFLFWALAVTSGFGARIGFGLVSLQTFQKENAPANHFLCPALFKDELAVRFGHFACVPILSFPCVSYLSAGALRAFCCASSEKDTQTFRGRQISSSTSDPSFQPQIFISLGTACVCVYQILFSHPISDYPSVWCRCDS